MIKQILEIRRYADVIYGKAQELKLKDPHLHAFLFDYCHGIIRNEQSLRDEMRALPKHIKAELLKLEEKAVPVAPVDTATKPDETKELLEQSVSTSSPETPVTIAGNTVVSGVHRLAAVPKISNTERARQILASTPTGWYKPADMTKLLKLKKPGQGSNVLNEAAKSLSAFRHYEGANVFYRLNPEWDIAKGELKPGSKTLLAFVKWVGENKHVPKEEQKERFARVHMIQDGWNIDFSHLQTYLETPSQV